MVKYEPGEKKNLKAVILSYHRICDTNSDPWGLCVTPQHFSEHLEVLRASLNPSSLQDLVEGNMENGSVVITFDDGYADNLQNATPLLEVHGIHATVFVVSGFIGGREFWWDQLERIFLQSGRLPQDLHLNINGQEYRWHLKETTDYSEEAALQNRSWRAWESPATARHAVYYSVWEQLRIVEEKERQKCVDQLLSWAGLSADPSQNNRTLSYDELVTLGQSKFIEIGSHTVTHPSLPKLSISDQKNEIVESKKKIETIIDKPLTTFAYPYGDYTAETASIVQQNGFRCACSTAASPVILDTSPYELPRFQVHDWNGDQFAHQLLSWFGRD
jgi:peptidoglycan/xylan/chitin deacetylase (PgdA/CDA1 family)